MSSMFTTPFIDAPQYKGKLFGSFALTLALSPAARNRICLEARNTCRALSTKEAGVAN